MRWGAQQNLRISGFGAVKPDNHSIPPHILTLQKVENGQKSWEKADKWTVWRSIGSQRRCLASVRPAQTVLSAEAGEGACNSGALTTNTVCGTIPALAGTSLLAGAPLLCVAGARHHNATRRLPLRTYWRGQQACLTAGTYKLERINDNVCAPLLSASGRQ
jgi:hypothetical protein